MKINPNTPHAMPTLLLSTAYLAPIEYYAHLYAAGSAVEDRGEHYVKQTFRNRCYIATPNGPQALTLPVVRNGAAHTPTRDIRLSDHGNWQHLHWNALVSAYDNSPYFEYYADDFRCIYERKYEFLADFNADLRQVILDELSLDLPVNISTGYVDATPAEDFNDLRLQLSPKMPTPAPGEPSATGFRAQPYYQVFAERTGFLPNLSMVDLLFNMGPESRLVLRGSLKPTNDTKPAEM